MEIFRPILRVSAYLNLSKRVLCSSLVRQEHYKVVIVGGGCGGTCTASRLVHKLGKNEVAIVEPSEVHYYQPLWTLVGAGIKPMHESAAMTRDVLPPNVHWIQDKVTQFQPEASKVQLSNGKELTYDHLVLALGFELRYDKILGAIPALEGDPRVVSNYSPKYVEKTFSAYKDFKGGKALFTLPMGAIKCAGAPQKVMYLFDDYLRKTNRRDQAEIHYFTALPKMFSVDKYANNLAEICKQRGIQYHLQHHLVEVNSAKSEAKVENIQTKEQSTFQYDFLHITPPMTIPAVLQSVPKLTNPDFVDVNAETLQHNHYPNIWSLGDCSSLPTSKTAAAISSQSEVLCKNLSSVLNGGPANVAKYDGYTACPLVTSYRHAIFAEFDYTMKPLETFPIDQGRESRFLYFIKKEILPPLYWDWFMKGQWSGPKKLRKLLRFGFSK